MNPGYFVSGRTEREEAKQIICIFPTFTDSYEQHNCFSTTLERMLLVFFFKDFLKNIQLGLFFSLSLDVSLYVISLKLIYIYI